MRLIFVTDTLCSGGAERVISILANNFCNKYETEIICLRKRDVFYDIDSLVNVVHADDHANGFIKKTIWLRNYLKEDDVIIPFMVKVYCVVLLSLLGCTRIVIASERNDPRTTTFIWKILRRLLLYKLSALVVQSQTIKDYFPLKYTNKIHVILNPLDVCQCSNKSWDAESNIILAVGRIDQQKNYPMMIRAFHNVRKKFPVFELEIWGSRKNTESELLGLINSLDESQSIHIHGSTDRVNELYQKAYMFVMSSDYEGLSNALIEAICSGLPVVSTKVSGAIDIIKDGENGILVDIGDEKAFEQAIIRLIGDREFARKISEMAKKSRPLFNLDYICSQWEGLIKKFQTEK